MSSKEEKNLIKYVEEAIKKRKLTRKDFDAIRSPCDDFLKWCLPHLDLAVEDRRLFVLVYMYYYFHDVDINDSKEIATRIYDIARQPETRPDISKMNLFERELIWRAVNLLVDSRALTKQDIEQIDSFYSIIAKCPAPRDISYPPPLQQRQGFNIALLGLGVSAISRINSIISKYPSKPVVSVGSGKGYLEYYLEKNKPGLDIICVDPSTTFGLGKVMKRPAYPYASDLPDHLKKNCILIINYVPFGARYDKESIELLRPDIVLFIFSNIHSQYLLEDDFEDYSKEIELLCFHRHYYSALMKWTRIDPNITNTYLPSVRREMYPGDYASLKSAILDSDNIPRLKSIIARFMNKKSRESRNLRAFYNYLSTKQRLDRLHS